MDATLRRTAGSIAAALLAACGGEEMMMTPETTSAEVRTFWGLNPGSCWQYEIMGTRTFATVTITGPDTQSIAGRTVYRRAYQGQAGGFPDEWFLDAETAPEIRLARSAETVMQQRVTKIYTTDPLPLFARIDRDRTGTLAFEGTTFETTSVPRDGTAETHTWTVFPAREEVATPDGTREAIKLSYTRGTGTTANFFLVPGFGFAKFTDFENRPHQVCAATVCDAAGNCTGDCEALCPR